MNYKTLRELMPFYDETFASNEFIGQIETYAERYGKPFVIATMRKAQAISSILGWKKSSFSLFTAIMYGDLQMKLSEEGEEDAKPTD